MMLNAHTLIKSMVSHGLAESVAEDIVNNLASEERVNKLEESMIKPSEFTVAINNLRHDIADLKNELKSDISELRSELKGDIAKLDHKIIEAKGELRVDIAKSKNDNLQWMMTLFVATVGMILGLYFK